MALAIGIRPAQTEPDPVRPVRLVDARRWVTLGVLAALSVVFGALWMDWIKTLLNSRGGGLAFSIQEIPMLLFPVIAFLGQTRRRT